MGKFVILVLLVLSLCLGVSECKHKNKKPPPPQSSPPPPSPPPPAPPCSSEHKNKKPPPPQSPPPPPPSPPPPPPCSSVSECKHKIKKPPPPQSPPPPAPPPGKNKQKKKKTPPPHSPPSPPPSPPPPPTPLHPKFQYSEINCRAHFANLSNFGAVGDGKTLNTIAFNKAIANLSKLAPNGGALLFVPAGKWLTGSFSLISHFTLFLHKDAVILGSEEESDYPLTEPLPSYGKGRDGGNRFTSLIFGTNLTDVVVTGANGTIDGQGEIWWKKFKGGKLKNTRPYILEIMHSTGVQISNLTLYNSPSWNVHPVYCTNVIIEQITIYAPVVSPNTDGINPDSCKGVRIRDSKVTSGDDCIAIKSGWDEYGIQYGMPTQDVSIKGFTCISPDSAVIAIGSEMSGGVRNVRAENIYANDSQSGIRIKTGVGRGSFVEQIYAQNMVFEGMKFVFWMNGDYGSHPDGKWNRSAYPVINDINYRNVKARGVYKYVGNLNGIEGHPFTGICISNVTAEMTQKKKSVSDETEAKKEKPAWVCSNIEGISSQVSPKACEQLKETEEISNCHYPTDVLPIDKIVLNKCYG